MSTAFLSDGGSCRFQVMPKSRFSRNSIPTNVADISREMANMFFRA